MVEQNTTSRRLFGQFEGAATVDENEHVYKIDELANISNTTVRNIRAYIDKSLLPPAKRMGRVSLYSNIHVARLKLISDLLERGYSLSNIGELITAWESDQNVGEILGLEAILAAPWTDRTPITLSGEDLLNKFESVIDPDSIIMVLEEAINLGVLSVQGNSFKVLEPEMLEAGITLSKAGVPIEATLRTAKELESLSDKIAKMLVDLITTHVFDVLGEPIPKEEIHRVTELISRLRPIAKSVVDISVSRALEKHVRNELGERVTRVKTDKEVAS